MSELESNSIDGLFHASYKPEREKIGVYPKIDGIIDQSRKVMEQAYHLYLRRDSSFIWDGNNLPDINGSVGAMLGYSIVDDLKVQGVIVDEVSTQFSNLMKLASGRIAAVAGIEEMNDFQIDLHKSALSNIVKVEPPIKQKAYYLIFSRKFARTEPELMSRIWDAIIDVQESPQYAEILNKYMER